MLLGVLSFAVDLGQQRAIGETGKQNRQQVRLCWHPRGEAFPKGWVTECPAGCGERWPSDAEEAAREGLQSPHDTGRSTAGPVDNVALHLGQGEQILQAAVRARRVDEREGGLLVSAELPVDVPEELSRMGHEFEDAGPGR